MLIPCKVCLEKTIEITYTNLDRPISTLTATCSSCGAKGEDKIESSFLKEALKNRSKKQISMLLTAKIHVAGKVAV